MNRREFLKTSARTLGAGTVLTAGAGLSACGTRVTPLTTVGERMRHEAALGQLTWSNWSEGQACHPQAMLTPTSTEELAQMIRTSERVRFVGAGHSFMPLVCTDQTIISLDPLAGVMAHDPVKNTATILGGTRLSQVNRDLDVIGQSLCTLPDVVYQSIAGAVSTGTHGTGKNYTALHDYIIELKLMHADGSILTCSAQQNSDVFQAAKVALGSLGALVELTLQNRPSEYLHRRVWIERLDEVLRHGAQWFEQYEHFELMYLPHTGMCLLIAHEPYTGEIAPRAKSEDDDGLNDLKKLRDYVPAAVRPFIARWLIRPGQELENAKDQAWRLLAQPRPSKFNESEYHIPKERGFECFAQVCAEMDRIPQAFYPIEFRLTRADQAWLSPFYQRDCHSIAVHADHAEPYDYLLSRIGPIFKAHQGRPHWGKLNDLGFAELAALYPRWHDFLRVRAELDPHGKFLNPYTERIFNAI